MKDYTKFLSTKYETCWVFQVFSHFYSTIFNTDDLQIKTLTSKVDSITQYEMK